MSRKKIVITGYSALTPLGNDIETSWEAILQRKSGIAKIQLFDTTNYATHIAGEIKNFSTDGIIPPKQAKRMDRFCQFAYVAGDQLMKNTGIRMEECDPTRFGIILGVGLGGLMTFEKFHNKVRDEGPSKVSPFSIPMLISNMAPGHIAIHIGAKGTNLVCTSACASSLHSIGTAYDQLLLDREDAIMTGGAESSLTTMGVSGFTAMRALCTAFEDEPEKACRPFDSRRGGFVMSEGAGFIQLETLEFAKKRNAHIYAEVLGFGASDDAYHFVAPLESGEGMAIAMKKALRDANLPPEAIDVVSAHGTSTHANDLAETRAIHIAFGEHAKKLHVFGLKSQIGHMLGAAGGAAAAFAVKTLETGYVPATINLTDPDPECDLDYTADGPKKLDPEHIMINSFGFGGTNASLILGKYHGE